MDIQVAFDDTILTDYKQRGSPAFFFIHIVVGEKHYPNPKWMDFGAVIVGWWIEELTKLMAGQSEAVLSFMDGPHNIRLAKNIANGELRCYTPDNEIIGVTSVSALKNALHFAARKIVDHLSAVDMDNINVNGLRTLIARTEKMAGSIT